MKLIDVQNKPLDFFRREFYKEVKEVIKLPVSMDFIIHHRKFSFTIKPNEHTYVGKNEYVLTVRENNVMFGMWIYDDPPSAHDIWSLIEDRYRQKTKLYR